jgi:hypothetical protein
METAMGVSEYELTKALPKQLKREMPSIDELKSEIEKFKSTRPHGAKFASVKRT